MAVVIIMQIIGDCHVKHLAECPPHNRCFLDGNLIIPDFLQRIGKGHEEQMKMALLITQTRMQTECGLQGTSRSVVKAR